MGYSSSSAISPWTGSWGLRLWIPGSWRPVSWFPLSSSSSSSSSVCQSPASSSSLSSGANVETALLSTMAISKRTSFGKSSGFSAKRSGLILYAQKSAAKCHSGLPTEVIGYLAPTIKATIGVGGRSHSLRQGVSTNAKTCRLPPKLAQGCCLSRQFRLLARRRAKYFCSGSNGDSERRHRSPNHSRLHTCVLWASSLQI